MSFGAKYFFDQQKIALVNIVKPTLLDLEKFKSLLNMNSDKKNFNALYIICGYPLRAHSSKGLKTDFNSDSSF